VEAKIVETEMHLEKRRSRRFVTQNERSVAFDNSLVIDAVDNSHCISSVAVESICHRSMPSNPSPCSIIDEVLFAINQIPMKLNDDSLTTLDVFPSLMFDDNKNDGAMAVLVMVIKRLEEEEKNIRKKQIFSYNLKI
jgi:hypothetical protein